MELTVIVALLALCIGGKCCF